MMVGEKDFPVILIWETDRMVFEMPIGINGFVIAVTPINVCPGIGRGVNDCKCMKKIRGKRFLYSRDRKF